MLVFVGFCGRASVLVLVSDQFFNRDALELGFALGFFALDLFVVREMLDVFWVGIGLVGLGFGGGMELLFGSDCE
jgi:hypothetical protein